MSNKILIVDDSPDDREIMERFLNEAGFDNLIFSESGEKAIELVSTENPGIVVTDTRLPGMNGFDVCQKIKEGSKEIKVIIMTGIIDAVDAGRARRVGADDYCVKTTEFEHLIETLKNI